MRNEEQIGNGVCRCFLNMDVSPQDRARAAIIFFAKGLSVHTEEELKTILEDVVRRAEQAGGGEVDPSKFDPPKFVPPETERTIPEEWVLGSELAGYVGRWLYDMKDFCKEERGRGAVLFAFPCILRSVPQKRRRDFLMWVKTFANRYIGSRIEAGADIYHHILNMDVTPRERACTAACVFGRALSTLTRDQQNTIIRGAIRIAGDVDKEKLEAAKKFDVPEELSVEEWVKADKMADRVSSYVSSIKGFADVERGYALFMALDFVFCSIPKKQEDDFLAMVISAARACKKILEESGLRH